jgi:hypothetical protein
LYAEPPFWCSSLTYNQVWVKVAVKSSNLSDELGTMRNTLLNYALKFPTPAIRHTSTSSNCGAVVKTCKPDLKILEIFGGLDSTLVSTPQIVQPGHRHQWTCFAVTQFFPVTSEEEMENRTSYFEALT